MSSSQGTVNYDIKSLSPRSRMSKETRKSSYSKKSRSKKKFKNTKERETRCEIHNQKNEVFCFKCRKQICTKCALFGNHKVNKKSLHQRAMI